MTHRLEVPLGGWYISIASGLIQATLLPRSMACVRALFPLVRSCKGAQWNVAAPFPMTDRVSIGREG